MNTKTKLQKIQQLDIGKVQLTMLALVILGKKPAMELSLYTWNTDSQSAIALLQSIKLTVYNAGLRRGGNKNHCASLCISNNPSDASLLLSLAKIRETSNGLSVSYHVAYGALMGYPLSAIEGFIAKKTLPEEESPLDDTETLHMFKLSKDNWKTELETISSWRKALQENAPAILEKLDKVIVT